MESVDIDVKARADIIGGSVGWVLNLDRNLALVALDRGEVTERIAILLSKHYNPRIITLFPSTPEL